MAARSSLGGEMCGGFRRKLVVLAFACLAVFAPIVAAAENTVRYRRDILPILSDRCFKCHGPDEKARKAKLRLDVRDAAVGKAKSGVSTIVPGKPDESLVAMPMAVPLGA